MIKKSNFSEEEWLNRVNLSACYHLADHFQFSDIIWNHITAKTSSVKHTFLINNFGLRYDEITASNLIEVDLKGNIVSGDGSINDTGFIIHGAIHRARNDVNCIMHTHSRAGLAISCLKDGLKLSIQDAAIFYKSTSYHDWQGMSTEEQECEILAKNLGKNNVMILRNHGLLTCGKTVGETFMLMYYLDRACKNQIDTLSMNQELVYPSNKVMEYAANQYKDSRFQLGKNEWPALLRLLDDKNSIYRN
jgi:ribulose-5-phosphate 4-epimerase/fuculose-1-phosphate aldolase